MLSGILHFTLLPLHVPALGWKHHTDPSHDKFREALPKIAAHKQSHASPNSKRHTGTTAMQVKVTLGISWKCTQAR